MGDEDYRGAGRWTAPGGGRRDDTIDDAGAPPPPPAWGSAAPPQQRGLAQPGTGPAPTGWGPGPGGHGQGWNAPGENSPGWNSAGWNSPGWSTPGHGHGWVAPPKPGVIPLRPLAVGEILDGSLQAARRNAKAMIGSSLLFNVLMGVLSVLFLITAAAPFLGLVSETGSTLSRSQAQSVLSAMPALFLGQFVIVAVALVGNTVLQGALVVPVSRAVLDQRTGFRQMWSMVRPRIGALIGLAFLLAAIGVGAGIVVMIVLFVVGAGLVSASNDATGAIVLFLLTGLALAVVGVWFAVRLSLCGAVLVLEKCGPGQALARSWRLTRGSFWRLFGILALTTILVQIVTSIAGAPLQFAFPLLTGVLAPTGAGLNEGGAGLLVVLLVAYLVLSTVIGAVTTVFMVGVTALLYVDLRMRREGLDVALMAEHDRLAAGSASGAVPGTA